MTDRSGDTPAAAPPPGWGEREPGKRRTRWRRRLLLGIALFLVLVLVVGVVHLWRELPCGGYASGVRSVDGQCVGITDAGHIFHESYTEVQNLIAEENDRVDEQAGGHVVTIAFLGTFTFGEVSPMDPGRMRRSLEGAYTAQMRANHTHHFSDPKPQIRLVLANIGGQQKQWETVVDDLLPMTEDPEAPLVAVTGMGVSVESTRQIAERLSTANVPMVSSAVTADGLEHREIPGLLRVAPSNTQYVRALRAYLDGLEEKPRATLVYDLNEPDLFVTTLRRAYEDRLSGFTVGHPQEYVGTTLGETPRSGLFNSVTLNVCASTNDTVLFAGRAPDLNEFLASLAERGCKERHLRILFVVTGLSVLDDDEAMGHLRQGNMSLVYASAIDPRWSTSAGEDNVPEHYVAFASAFHARVGGGDERALNNGYALVNHDAVAVATEAVRISNERGLEELPTAEEVYSQLMLLNNAHAVPAGGGVLSYSDNLAGEAVGRYVPVVELPLEGDDPLPNPHVIRD